MNEDKLKETKEFLIGFFELGAMLSMAFKDGVQATDASEVLARISNNEALRAVLLGAYNGANQIPAELSSATVWEELALAPEIVKGIQKVMESLKK